MKDSQILSTLTSAQTHEGVAHALHHPQVFDACEAGVVLRAVAYVELVTGTGLMYQTEGVVDWFWHLALVTARVLPATLFWLVTTCAAKTWLARLPWFVQVSFAVVLGALAGLAAGFLLNGLGLVNMSSWIADAVTGTLLAAGLVAGLVWRARGTTPATVKARLAELQARIQPHFLFNTLNTAIALVRNEPAKAEQVLEDLADVFRHALLEQTTNSTVCEEIALARRYLDIEQMRFGSRLIVQWALDARVNNAKLPALILQPLVENAVKHGVEPSTTGAHVRISTHLRGQMALIKVTNTIPCGQGRAGLGMALNNVRARLRLLHDFEGQFRAALRDGVYQARIQVPMPRTEDKS